MVLNYFKSSTDFADKYFNLINLGLSGSHVANNGVNSFYQRRTQIPATTDLLTIFGGHNDWGSSTIGVIATSSFDDTTFIGAYQAVIEYALGLNSSIRIQLVIPHAAYSGGVKRTMDSLNQAIRDVADYYGLPVLDLDTDLGYNAINEDQYLTDGLHLNSNGINIVGKRLYNFIKEKY